MRIGGNMKARAGVTLVEVMLAGAMAALTALTTFEGFIVAAKVAHENAEALRADNIAFDLLWRKFYGDYEQMRPTTGTTPPLWKTYESPDSPYVKQGSDPLASAQSEYPPYLWQEFVDAAGGVKRLTVKLYDGKKYEANGELVLLRQFSVSRSEIPRTTN